MLNVAELMGIVAKLKEALPKKTTINDEQIEPVLLNTLTILHENGYDLAPQGEAAKINPVKQCIINYEVSSGAIQIDQKDMTPAELIGAVTIAYDNITKNAQQLQAQHFRNRQGGVKEAGPSDAGKDSPPANAIPMNRAQRRSKGSKK